MQCQNCGDILDNSEMPKRYRSSAFEDEESGEMYITETVEQSGRCPRCGTITMRYEDFQEEVDIEANEYL